MTKEVGLSPVHSIWLETERGLSVDLCNRFGLMSRGKEIGFPYRQSGNVKYVKWRALDKSSMRVAPSDVSQIPYNIDELSEVDGNGQTLVIVEGEFDCIAIAHTGHHVISVPNGAPQAAGTGDIDPREDGRFGWLWSDGKLRSEIAKFHRIVLFTDNDGPGQILRDELAVRVGRARCYVPVFPGSCKDPNDILFRYGVEELGRCIREASALVPSKFVKLSDLPKTPPKIGLLSGWSGLDPHLKLTFPELVTVTGAPGSGKSQWVLAWLCNLARDHGIKTAIIDFENGSDRIEEDILNYASAKWNGASISDPVDWMDQHFCIQPPPEPLDDEEPVTIEWIREAIEDCACRHDCKVLLIDCWNEVEHAWSRGQSESQYTNDALRELKRLARRFQIALIIVAHPTKDADKLSLQNASLYAVSGSAAWNNKSDHGVIILREEGAEETQVKISKSKRYKTMGVPGVVTMKFAPEHSTFTFVRKGA